MFEHILYIGANLVILVLVKYYGISAIFSRSVGCFMKVCSSFRISSINFESQIFQNLTKTNHNYMLNTVNQFHTKIICISCNRIYARFLESYVFLPCTHIVSLFSLTSFSDVKHLVIIVFLAYHRFY